ncbi:unnamed protein product [Leptidea sinapis]|uniref:Uncharacterized protein n=1 Tax=Leptidea sinapis TaxID=189913 RepID=A0A5E4PQE9_9NEOP|nr:unnamed protein product [Leptidea sinapis]
MCDRERRRRGAGSPLARSDPSVSPTYSFLFRMVFRRRRAFGSRSVSRIQQAHKTRPEHDTKSGCPLWPCLCSTHQC